MNRGKFTIKLNDPHPGIHRVFLNGVDISNGITGFELEANTREFPQLELKPFIVDVTEIQDVEARYYLPHSTVELLKQLGWTPPEES